MNVGKWEFMEAGWYIHLVYGGICKETAESVSGHEGGGGPGWYYFPKRSHKCHGPYKTLKEAIAVGDRRKGR